MKIKYVVAARVVLLILAIKIIVIKYAFRNQSSKQETYLSLNNGLRIPLIGIGTAEFEKNTAYEALRFAIVEAGYRHIDCALIYENEEEVGIAIKTVIDEGIVKREDLFVTSKLGPSFHKREKVIVSLRLSLKSLGLSYVDLFLMHSPMNENATDSIKNEDYDVDYLETWKGMEDCLAAGLTKSIGLSNFNSSQIKRILNEGRVKPAMNQIECHPYLTQTNLIKFCLSNGIMVTAYSPLGSFFKTGPFLLKDKKLKEIGLRHNKSAAQIALRFQVQRGIVAVAYSSSHEHIKQNIQIFDFKLSKQEMDDIFKLNKDLRIHTVTGMKYHKYYPFWSIE